MKNNKVKFGVKFKDNYKVEFDVEEGHQLQPVSLYISSDNWGNQYFIWDNNAYNQLFGQIMTLVDAIIEEPTRKKAVKDLFRKELSQFEQFLTERCMSDIASENTNK